MRDKFRFLTLLLLCPLLGYAQGTTSYTATNLVSDGSVPAQQTDPSMINPWGVAIGQKTPFWINAAGGGVSEVYDGSVTKQFVVGIPAAAGSTAKGTPTGIALNPSSTDFALPQGAAATFLFDSLDGTISAWYSGLTNAEVVVDNSAAGASYTGLTIANNGTANFLLAANFAKGRVDVFDARFQPATLSGNFVDPNIPSGFAPFNVHVVASHVYVTYALQNGGGPPTRAAGAGYVSAFDMNGNLVARAISGGNLNAPWGIAVAPAGFGQFGGDLLVGNFGDGTINAYDATSFTLRGQLQDATGAPIEHDRLWEILFGQNGTGDPNTLYFSAGVNNEQGGLFGSIAVTGPPVAGDFQISTALPGLTLAAGASGSLQIQVAPTSGFSAPVTFSVTGLPAGLSAQFNPSTVTPTAGAGVTTTLTIGPSAPPPPSNPYVATYGGAPGRNSGMIAMAAFLPLGLATLLPLMRTRRKVLAVFTGGGSLAVLLLVFTLSGCGGNSGSANAGTVAPAAGSSTVTVNATAGSLVHSTTFRLTVQ
jgi:uncharacterized protein (TIGR03118 family)